MSSDDSANAAPGSANEIIITEIQAFLNEVRTLVLALQDDPDEITVEQALQTLAKIRDGMEQTRMFQRCTQKLRDKLVAHLSTAAPNLTMRTIAAAAGYGDSYAARVAKGHGTARRRPRDKADPPAPTRGQVAASSPANGPLAGGTHTTRR